MTRENHYSLEDNNMAKKQLNFHGLILQQDLTTVKRRNKPEILFITSYPPRECGIATYSQDLINALNNKFENSFHISICALETDTEQHNYENDPKFILNTDEEMAFENLAKKINKAKNIQIVVVQHEFGFFANHEQDFKLFYEAISMPLIFVFHTVLPRPDNELKLKVQNMARVASSVIVMTKNAAIILSKDYLVSEDKVTVIPHGTHLVPPLIKEDLKSQYNLSNKKVLSTFGLLGSGKSIETTLDAMPAIVEAHDDALFLIIGKTHPSVSKHEGEKYRAMLEQKVIDLKLENHVRFVNQYLPLNKLLEYLQMTDIYLFTSKDPNQAVSGTFSYAISCGCPVISTPIPHAKEVLMDDAGIIIDFEHPKQLSDAVIRLLDDNQLRINISLNGLHKMAATAWENAAIAHAMLFEKVSKEVISLEYKLPEINLHHIKKMTNDFGMVQFAKIYKPDIDSGYTLDDNARAMIAICQHYEISQDKTDLSLVQVYLNFIQYCLQPNGTFLNYVNEEKEFTEQNGLTNLEDSNGRAIWALGYLISLKETLPTHFSEQAEDILRMALPNLDKMYSSRAMAFVIKGLYYQNDLQNIPLLQLFADRLVQMYRHEASEDWKWFESYLTYGNSIIPEALLCAWLSTGKEVYKEISKASFDFLLSKIFNDRGISVISNKGWLHKIRDQKELVIGGEQPIDVAYTIMALGKFYAVFEDAEYAQKLETAFHWFLGNNHMHQIIYNPCTGGCYDGLEENYINLNQGAESTVSYLMARLQVASFMKEHPNSNSTAATPQELSRTIQAELIEIV